MQEFHNYMHICLNFNFVYELKKKIPIKIIKTLKIKFFLSNIFIFRTIKGFAVYFHIFILFYFPYYSLVFSSIYYKPSFAVVSTLVFVCIFYYFILESISFQSFLSATPFHSSNFYIHMYLKINYLILSNIYHCI